MTKLTLSDINTLNDAVATINTNNSLIESAIENTLSRDGTSPNTMETPLDMNNARLYNLPQPLTNTDAATKGYVDALAGTFDPSDDPVDITFADLSASGNLTVGGHSTMNEYITVDSDSFTQAASTYKEGASTNQFASSLFTSTDSGHPLDAHSTIQVQSRPVGSGVNGPTTADYGMTISLVKQDFDLGTSAGTGELDGLQIGVRQGGTESDSSCILGNILQTGTGFSAFAETITILAPPPSFAATQSVRLQMGVIDNKSPAFSFGYFASADTGTIGEAFRAGTNGGSFNYLFLGQKNGTDVFTVNGDGKALATTGLGYGVNAGGQVIQATSKSTGVTLNKACGTITMNNATLNAGTIVSFTFTNSLIEATDVLVLNHITGGTPGSYTLNARAGIGQATIDVRNNTGGNLSEAVQIQYALIKATIA